MTASAESGRFRQDEIGFERLAAHHRANERGYLLYAVFLAVIGIVVVALGLAGIVPSLAGWVVGIVTVLVAMFPYLASLEHRERCEGLTVLRDENLRIHAASGSTDSDREQLMELISRSYGQAHRNA